MKKLFDGIGWVFILAILFSSCSSIDSKIVDRQTDQQCKFMPPAVASQLTPGMQYVSPVNADGTVQVCDSIYAVQPSHAQKEKLMHFDGTFKWLIILPILGLLIIGIGQYLLSNSIGGYAGVIITCTGILVAGGGPASVWWADTKTAQITKAVYNQEMADHGNLAYWWEEEGNLYQ